MSNPAYFPLEYAISFISENASCAEYEITPDPSQWDDEEIKAIRLVLQKLTALRVPDSNDAEDIVQDTLLTLITKCPQTGLEKGRLVWSMGILRNKVGNYYRKTQRYASGGAKESSRQTVPSPSHAPSPEGGIFHEELQKIIDGTLAQLPSPQRQAMELLLAGFETREIANQLSPERYQNVINRLHRGRKKLAQELAKYGYGPDTKYGMRKMKKCGLRK